MTPIDLRSDTVTRPSEAMREAMMRADVGDDVYGEDPTVNRLQEVAAERVGKAAALLVPSGTMANQSALRALSSPGDVVLAGETAHVLTYEGGAAAALSGLQVTTLGSGGLFEAGDIDAAIPPSDVHYAPVKVVTVENTHNAGGGRVWPRDQLQRVTEAARRHGCKLHLDGARLFNAAAASRCSPAELAQPFDSVSFCLSKGLGAPVGSLVCGSLELVRIVHRMRKILGGAMRQAGILAAAGLHALEYNVERLAEDHANARRLADGLASLGLELECQPETNIVLFRVDDAPSLSRALREEGLLINPMTPRRLRAVTHLDVTPCQIDQALEIVARVTRRS